MDVSERGPHPGPNAAVRVVEQLRQSIREVETLQRDIMPRLEEALKATRYAERVATATSAGRCTTNVS